MAPKKRPFAELGSVGGLARSYRAKFNFREGQKVCNIYGPRRGNQQRALGELHVIRAAAAEHTSRADGLEAMQAAAERMKEAAATEAGGIEEVEGEHRARVRCADTSGEPRQIKGPHAA